MSNLALISNI